jgi:hypothetical protein
MAALLLLLLLLLFGARGLPGTACSGSSSETQLTP